MQQRKEKQAIAFFPIFYLSSAVLTGIYSCAGMVKEAIKEAYQAGSVCTIGEAIFPEKPLIQYKETDWEFVRRLASQLKGVLYPDITSPFPRFYFGFPNERERRRIEVEEYRAGFSEHYYELGRKKAGYQAQDFIFYEVQTPHERYVLRHYDLENQ